MMYKFVSQIVRPCSGVAECWAINHSWLF